MLTLHHTNTRYFCVERTPLPRHMHSYVLPQCIRAAQLKFLFHGPWQCAAGILLSLFFHPVPVFIRG